MTRAIPFDLRDHGIACRRGLVLSCVVSRDRIYLGLNQAGARFLLVEMDAATGACAQFQAPDDCSAPWGQAVAPDGRVLITSKEGNLCLFDPAAPTLRRVAHAETWFWTITGGSDGRYYLGGSPGAELFRFALETHALESCGSADAVQKYLRIVVGGDDGFVYGSIGCTAAQVVSYEIATGQFRKLLPATEELPGGWHAIGRGNDGRIYTKCLTGSVYRLENGSATLLATESWSGFAPVALPDGCAVSHTDEEVKIGDATFPLRYEADGTKIFQLGPGPDGCVYGGTEMPLYLFRYDPARDVLECLGRGGQDTGEVYSLGHVGGKLYYATYSGGRLMCYDPAPPWQPGNPREVGVLGEGHNRPRAMVVDSRQRVWVGSYAEYGRMDGGLACYDTAHGRWENNPVVIPNQSIVSLAADDRFVYGGTHNVGGSGTEPVATEARLFAWDIAARRIAWEFAPIAGDTMIQNLIQHRARLYGTSRPSGSFFVVDAATRKLVSVQHPGIGNPREQAMALASDGHIYGITWRALFRFRPDGAVEELLACDGDEAKNYNGNSLFHRGVAIVGDRFYFSCGASLMSVRLPLTT